VNAGDRSLAAHRQMTFLKAEDIADTILRSGTE
jgi:hypothetical protein